MSACPFPWKGLSTGEQKVRQGDKSRILDFEKNGLLTQAHRMIAIQRNREYNNKNEKKLLPGQEKFAFKFFFRGLRREKNAGITSDSTSAIDQIVYQLDRLKKVYDSSPDFRTYADYSIAVEGAFLDILDKLLNLLDTAEPKTFHRTMSNPFEIPATQKFSGWHAYFREIATDKIQYHLKKDPRLVRYIQSVKIKPLK